MNVDRISVRPGVAGLFVLMLAVIWASGSGVVMAQQYKEIKRLGTSQALCKPIQTGAELQGYFRDNRDTVLAVLEDAGWEGDPDALFGAIAAGDFSERAYPPGTELLWMGRKVKGKPNASRFIRWAGDKPFDAFLVEVESNGQRSTFAIPKVCCNLSLVSTEAVPAPVAPAPAPVVAEAEPQPPAKRVWPYVGPFVGIENRTRDTCNCIKEKTDPLVGGLGGVMFPTESERVVLLLQGGGAVNLDDPTFSAVFVDVGVDVAVGRRGFVGGGVGIWDLNDSTHRDGNVFLHVGMDTDWKVGDATTQWFLEGRLFMDQDDVDDINTDYAVLAGLRFVWK